MDYQVLNSLGTLYFRQEEYKKAAECFQNSINIIRLLIKSAPSVFIPELAMRLSNLASLHSEHGEYKNAINTCEESLRLYTELAKSNPEIYNPEVASLKNNLATIISKSPIARKEIKRIEGLYLDAIKIRTSLTENNLYVFGAALATSLHNIGNFYIMLKDDSETAEKFLDKALLIRRELYSKLGDSIASDLLVSLMDLGRFHFQVLKDKEKSIELCKEGVLLGLSLEESNTHIDKCINTCIKVLELCEFNIEEWLNSLPNPEA